ncbi:Condensin-2 complex subunit H2 [Saguinus oedipus]|uniref:Condensin-2 complex subunit H2 n=1 Tax=Saguinus oedipus TaxID=9490 RepID=A0ABQ9WJW1_SAGOE|nr:Condensin-2 complex subunit H2 [Saguinus oedipus]
MNFIEAALLIQGSACVYSKKVGPARRCSRHFCGQRAKQLSAVQEDRANGDASSGAPQEAEDEVSFLGTWPHPLCACLGSASTSSVSLQLLSLDDFPDSRTNVDLKNDQASSEVLIVPLLPMALVAPDETENNNPLYR